MVAHFKRRVKRGHVYSKRGWEGSNKDRQKCTARSESASACVCVCVPRQTPRPAAARATWQRRSSHSATVRHCLARGEIGSKEAKKKKNQYSLSCCGFLVHLCSQCTDIQRFSVYGIIKLVTAKNIWLITILMAWYGNKREPLGWKMKPAPKWQKLQFLKWPLEVCFSKGL